MKIAFQKSDRVNGTVSVENDLRMSFQLVRCELLGTSSGPMRRGSHRRELPRYGKIESISCVGERFL
jgi:hypothetical protein